MSKISIDVTTPPGVDVESLVCAYGALLTARNITHNYPTENIQLSHPLEESREIILNEFQQVSSHLGSITQTYRDVSAIGMKTDGRRLKIMLQCTNPNEEFINADHSHQSE